MASFNSYTGNGSTTNRAITFPYISQSHVHVYLDGVESADWTWFDSSTIQFNAAPANGVAILIQRETPVSERLAEFTNGEALLDEELNISALQALYAAEEAKDRANQSIAVNGSGVYDFNNRRGTNLATPTDASDAVNKAYADTVTTQAAAQATIATTQAGIATTKAAEAATDRAGAETARTGAETARTGAEAAKDAAEAAAASLDTSVFLTKADNLGSVTNAATARSNLGLAALAVKALIDAASLIGDGIITFAKLATGAVATQVQAEAGTATDVLMTPERTKQAITALAPPAKSILVHREYASGTHGGAGGTSWATLALNTVVKNDISGASLASNEITLPAGTYLAWATNDFANKPGQLRLYNSTDAAVIERGIATGSADGAGGRPLFCLFTLAASKTVALQYRLLVASGGAADLGEARSEGIENYTSIILTKVA